MMNMLALLLQEGPPQGTASRGMTVAVIYLVSFGLIAYFLLIRPQKRMQQKHQEMVGGLKKGDEVMTEGGIIGTVVHIQDDRVTIKSGEARMVVARVKIARVFSATEPAERA